MQEHDQSSCPDVVHTPREADEKDGGHMVDNLLVKVLREEGPYTHTHIHTHTHTNTTTPAHTHTHKHTHTNTHTHTRARTHHALLADDINYCFTHIDMHICIHTHKCSL